MPKQTPRLYLTTFIVAVFTLLGACSESENTTTQKPQGIEKIEKEISKKKVILEEKVGVISPETNDGEPTINNAKTELTEIEQQLDALKEKLTLGNQDNALLRQHMSFLLEKIKENQQILDQQTQKITPKAE